MNILVYDDKLMMYTQGEILRLEDEYTDCIHFRSIDGQLHNSLPLSQTLTISVNNCKKSEYIKFDETTMKRIAKYNKEIELKEIDKKIKAKEKKLKELDNFLQDKKKRVEKIKEFVANIYNIDIKNDCNEDEEYYDD